MNKNSNNMRAVFGRALRFSIQTSGLFCTLAGLGIIILAPAVLAQKPPTAGLTGPNPRGGTQTVSATASLASPSQEPMQEQAAAPYIEKQAPVKPPQVSYEAGQLTIVAENSKLSDVLSSLRACMGADIDLPASASGERIWARLGPGPARKVLATLLSATKLDYVIQASDSDPDGIRNVWLTTRTTGSPVISARSAGSTAAAHPLPPRQSDTERGMSLPNHSAPPAPEDRAPEETVTPEPTVAADMAPAIAQPAQTDPAVVPTSAQAAATEVAAAANIQTTDASKPAGSATDQMIHTLQNMYEQRKQLQLARTPSGAN